MFLKYDTRKLLSLLEQIREQKAIEFPSLFVYADSNTMYLTAVWNFVYRRYRIPYTLAGVRVVGQKVKRLESFTCCMWWDVPLRRVISSMYNGKEWLISLVSLLSNDQIQLNCSICIMISSCETKSQHHLE